MGGILDVQYISGGNARDRSSRLPIVIRGRSSAFEVPGHLETLRTIYCLFAVSLPKYAQCIRSRVSEFKAKDVCSAHDKIAGNNIHVSTACEVDTAMSLGRLPHEDR